MLGLPKSARLNKPLPKKMIFDKFKPNTSVRRLFDAQVARLAVIAEISPQTVNILSGVGVAAIFCVGVTLKTPIFDKKNIALLSKLINQHMVFVLQYQDAARLAAYRSGQVLVSDSKPLTDWSLTLSGLNLDAVWECIISQIADIPLDTGTNLDRLLAGKERREALEKQIAVLEGKARSERQPRRKRFYFESMSKLQAEWERLNEEGQTRHADAEPRG